MREVTTRSLDHEIKAGDEQRVLLSFVKKSRERRFAPSAGEFPVPSFLHRADITWRWVREVASQTPAVRIAEQVPSAISHACALPQGSSATCVCSRYKHAPRLTLLSPKRVPDSWASDLWHRGTFGHSRFFVTTLRLADAIKLNFFLPQKGGNTREGEILLKSYHSNLHRSR